MSLWFIEICLCYDADGALSYCIFFSALCIGFLALCVFNANIVGYGHTGLLLLTVANTVQPGCSLNSVEM